MAATTLWELSGVDKLKFEAYTKLLRLRNKGQIEESSNFIQLPDENETETASLDGDESVCLNPLSQFDDNRLKRAFLDRLSELVANKKGGHYVSASSMFEWRDRVEILVGKNTGFKRNDPSLCLLNTIESNLRSLARLDRLDPVAIDTRQNLWNSLVESYTARIIVYMNEFKQSLYKTGRAALPDDLQVDLHHQKPSLISHLQIFWVLVNDVLRSSAQDRLDQAVQSAHDICILYGEDDFKEIMGSNAAMRSLRNSLGFLGRLQTCFHTLIRGAERLSNFQELRIIPVMDSLIGRVKSSQSKSAWSVLQTFTSLRIPLDDKTAESVVGNGSKKSIWTKQKLLQEFEKLKPPSSEVHAEIQVILAAAQRDHTGASIFKYIGCSKRSCFLCSKFCQAYDSLKTRGCHGKLYDLWTVPHPSRLTEGECSKLSSALKHVEGAMKTSIRHKTTEKLTMGLESTIGGSSIATINPRVENAHVASLIREHLQSQREDATRTHGKSQCIEPSQESFSNHNEYEATSYKPPSEVTPSHPSKTSQVSSKTQDECNVCGRHTSRRCSYCDLDWFCCQPCQERMSYGHLTKCSARSITTADRLSQYAVEDEIPEDEETREDFGFTRCRNWEEKSHLFGLYQGLLLYLDVGPVELNAWRQENILKRKIIEKFSQVPDNNKGAYFPWFFRNQHILDPSTPRPCEHSLVETWIAEARPLLDPEDGGKDLRKLEPPSKRSCFFFFVMVMNSSFPPADSTVLDIWYDFGFAVCNNDKDERALGLAYNRLVGGNKQFKDYENSLGHKSKYFPDMPTCSFEEFWRAWQEGKLIWVFEKYRRGPLVSRDFDTERLREFLSFPIEQDKLRPSVWRLKHFLALNDTVPLSGFPQIETVIPQYGFTPQLDARTRIALKAFYRKLFEVSDPLEVHEAKAKGGLLEFAQSTCMDIDGRVRDVLRDLDAGPRPTSFWNSRSLLGRFVLPWK